MTHLPAQAGRIQTHRCVARYRQASRHAAFLLCRQCFDAAPHRAGTRLPMSIGRDFCPYIKRAIETHAATAHESSVRRCIVCALCGVSFVIRNAPTELNRKKQ
ncbi:hypothetical protein BSLA_02f2401 [Burkholderia stabilis]|nr:hypothetical protein BSLA_02f2401 [Burkholderia stabilis]